MIFDGNTFLGLNRKGNDQLFIVLGYSNVSISNNLFLDVSWLDQRSILIEQFILGCSFEIYTTSIFENNTIINT